MNHVLTESNFTNVQVLTEDRTDGRGRDWIIEGIFIQADIVNRNRRVYPKQLMEAKIEQYRREYVQTRRAVGELSHPDTTEINLDNITHLIESITQDGANFVGRAKILNTPQGTVVRGLLEGGVKLGVSSRARGSTKQNSQGVNEVQDDFSLAAIDIVYQPSAPDAFVQGLKENADFVWDTICEADHQFLDDLKREVDNTKSANLEEKKLDAFQRFIEQLRTK